ncbi:hypothetical protein DFH27DRAFT_553731 [Peziza echinospora]|nr:hypothetical protein DFH27DRAFT_553731 [Peziza echinospora]
MHALCCFKQVIKTLAVLKLISMLRGSSAIWIHSYGWAWNFSQSEIISKIDVYEASQISLQATYQSTSRYISYGQTGTAAVSLFRRYRVQTEGGSWTNVNAPRQIIF